MEKQFSDNKEAQMKKATKLLTSLVLTASILCVPGAAEATGWYTMRAGNDVPPLPSEFSYLEEHAGYYVDRAATEDDRRIYLTFDAGYENGNIAKILDVLAEKEARGAFFILEHLAEAEPQLVMRMKNEGHLVCNHSATHPNMANMTQEQFAAELVRMDECYTALTGEPIARFYRPPEGKLSEESLGFAEQMGYKTVMWSFAYADWDNDKQPDPAASAEKILANTHNGMIILLHPTSATNAAILGGLIDAWRAMGYRFATLDELK